MKKNKIIIVLLLSCSLAFHGCTDWLNVEPRDRMLEPGMFSTEQGINSVLNGIYRDLSGRHLHGQYLSQTFIEYLARVYYWRIGSQHLPAAMLEWGYVAAFRYDNRNVHGKIQSIWDEAFRTIMRINILIENVEALEEGIMHENRRNVVLGEAHALRAFLHFDMFRLFGPIFMTDSHGGLPYNNTTEVIVHPNLPAAQFIGLVMEDLETALTLLENDPIHTWGVNDNFVAITGNIALTPEDIFANFYRNRRMNYFAVRALQARVLLHTGQRIQASAAARETLEAIGATFVWETNLNYILRDQNFIFHREVMFGLNNINLHYNWINLYDGMQPGQTHVVAAATLYNNFFGDFPGTALSAMTDIRSRQWQHSNITPTVVGGGGPLPVTYISTKFRQSAIVNWNNRPFLRDFQPLIRMSELYFIQAEAALHRGDLGEAAEMINTVMRHRGILGEQLIDPSTASISGTWDRLEREIYKEFIGEGQAFFFLKRNNRPRILSGAGTHEPIPDTRAVFVLPLPDSETIL